MHEHQERSYSGDSPPPGPGPSASAVESEPAREDAAPPEPVEVFLLDYDRELAYLQHEGRLRTGQRPTGFKR